MYFVTSFSLFTFRFSLFGVPVTIQPITVLPVYLVASEAGSGRSAFKNSIAIPLDEIEKRVKELPKDKELLIHCSTGARAEMAKAALDKAGLKSRVLIADVECEQGKCVITD